MSTTAVISHLELAAREVGNDPVRLKKRLQEARSVMTREGSKLFGKGRFDFENKRLIGENGLVLQWIVRSFPDLPVSYDNQQTNCGSVYLCCPKDHTPA